MNLKILYKKTIRRMFSLFHDATALASPKHEDDADQMPFSLALSFLDLIPEPAMIIDKKGEILISNEACKAYFKISLSLPMKLHHLVGHKHKIKKTITALLKDTENHMQQGNIAPLYLPIKDGKGEVKYFEMRFMVIKDENLHNIKVNRPVEYLFCMIGDQTRLMQFAQRQSDFVANVSHELRTPLTSLMGMIDTIGGAAKDDPIARARFLAIMADQAERMKRLIDDLLSLSQAESEDVPMEMQAIDLNLVLGDLAIRFKPLTEEKDMIIRLNKPEAPLMVWGNDDRLQELFENLIQNALKYGRRGTPIDIKLYELDQQAMVEISDYGIGIATADIPRLTERFYRVDKARSRAAGGTGLGLAIVKHILNRHHGHLKIDSKPNEGSVFTVTLPLLKQKET